MRNRYAMPWRPAYFEQEEPMYYCQKCRHKHRYNSRIGAEHAGKYGLMTREMEFA